MKYENSPCPVCGAHFREGDDIVVCPECATPHHRACWAEQGHCANEDKHQENFVWQPRELETEKAEPVEKSEAKICHICLSENSPDATNCEECNAVLPEISPENGKKCFYCGMTAPENATICPRCSAPFNKEQETVYNREIPGTEFKENDLIGENTAGELAIYVRSGAHKYLPKFKKIEKGKTFTFNWAALFLGPFWYYFRKIYRQGTAFLLLLATAFLLVLNASETMFEIVAPYAEQIEANTISQETLVELSNQITEKAFPQMSWFFLCVIILYVICAVYADRSYYDKIKRDLRTLNEEIPDKNMKQMIILRRGGGSVFSFLLAICFFEAFVSALIYLADYIVNYT